MRSTAACVPLLLVDDAPTDSVGPRTSETDDAEDRAEAVVRVVFVRARVAVDCREGMILDDEDAWG